MRKILCILLLFIPTCGFAQFIGIGSQWASNPEKFQFSLVTYAPYIVLAGEEPVAFTLGGGLEYSTSGPKISGLQIKPVVFSLHVPNPKHNKIFSFHLAGGYNQNFTHGNNGIIVSPSLYADWSAFYLSTGYEYNISHKEGQFFVRIGVGLTFGLFKDIFHY